MYLGLDTTGTGRGEWDVMEIMLVVSFLHSVRCTRYFDPGFSFSFGLGFDLWSYSPKRRRDLSSWVLLVLLLPFNAHEW